MHKQIRLQRSITQTFIFASKADRDKRRESFCGFELTKKKNNYYNACDDSKNFFKEEIFYGLFL